MFWLRHSQRTMPMTPQGIGDRWSELMEDLRYWQQRDWFSNLAFDAFEKYFDSRSEFDAFVDSIAGDAEKSRFLKVASFYKFLVKNGRFSVPGFEEAKYFDHTYRFLAIVALIEAVESSVSFKEFYPWLRKSAAFPIQSRQNLDTLHQQYKSQFGLMNKMVSFFRRLDGSSKREIESWIKVQGQPLAIDKLARTLYDIRSGFIHEARLIVDLSGMRTLSARHKGRVITLRLEQVERIFERGVLLRFRYAPPASWPK
jgi:hypothetical protein